MTGTVRVVSKRKGGLQPRDNETIIMVTNREERARVIAAYAQDFERDMAAGGPMRAAVNALAERVRQGENLAICCWCAPRSPCHGEVIRDTILSMLKS